VIELSLSLAKKEVLNQLEKIEHVKEVHSVYEVHDPVARVEAQKTDELNRAGFIVTLQPCER
jgi:DNA-binding Lrp family transcriptional regulator